MNKDNQGQHLEKKLNPMNVWALAFGCIIGWGAFVNPGKKFLPKSGTLGTAIALALGALIMIIIAFSYSYMVPKYPKAGGEFTFTKVCFGKNAAYICGWFLIIAYLANVPMNSTALGLIVDGLDGDANILRFGYLYTNAGFDIYLGEMLFAFLILILFAVFSIRGVKVAGVIQTILATLLAVSVFALTIAAIINVINGNIVLDNIKPFWGYDKEAALAAGQYSEALANNDKMSIMAGVLATLSIAPWAFVGFDTIPQASEEFNFKTKKVNFIMIIAIIFGGFVYIANNTIAAAAVTNYPELLTQDSGRWLLLEAARNLLGVPGVVLVGVAVFSAVLTGIMGFYMASSRLMYSMSKEGYLPKFFSKLDKKHNTPKAAMIFCMIVSLSGPILGREALGWFVDMSAIGASIGYGFTCLATLVTMKREGDKKPVLAILAVLGSLFSLIFLILQVVPIPGLEGVHFGNESYIMLAVWVVLGIVFYIFKGKQFTNTEEKAEV